MRSSGTHSHACTMSVIWLRRPRWVVTTPFGFPVVPLVYTISAPRSSSTATVASAAPAAGGAAPGASTTTTGTPRARATGPIFASRELCVRTQAAPLSDST